MSTLANALTVTVKRYVEDVKNKRNRGDEEIYWPMALTA
jgi:hypothetical protein